jgi:hypothetical protein
MKKRFALAFLLSYFLTGCGSSNSGPSMPGPATHFSVTAQATATAGIPISFTVMALDASNKVATSYSGTLHFTSTDAQAVLPGDTTLTAGTASFQVTFFGAGNQTITATDTAGSIAGTSAAISVKVLIATHFSVVAPATASEGTPFSFTVTALDASNNPVGTYTGTVHFTSTDGQAQLPGDQTLPNGSATLQATLITTGNKTITATDTVNNSITGTATITVMGATHFSIKAPASATTNSAFDIVVTALDASNNVVPAYTGTVHFSSTDPRADLPPTQTMTSGTQTFVAALKTTGSQTITVTDSVNAISGTSTINVSAAAAANPVPLIDLPLSPAAAAPGGSGFQLTVNGTGFVQGANVKWNGSSRTTIFVSRSRLTATIPASDVATPNTASVTVVNPGPGGGASNIVSFEATLPTSSVAFATSTLSPFLGPSGLATADFNRDGKLDLLIASGGGGTNVSVLLGKGDGTFQTPATYAAGPLPSAVTVADFNGDGKLDVAVGNSNGNNSSISILLGNGDGTFQAAVNYSVPCCPSSVTAADFNEDGKLDLVAATNAASVLLGNGDGTFQSVLNYGTASSPGGVAVGDFNGDGHLDLAVSNNGSSNISVLLGNGDGTFQPALDYAVGNFPIGVVTGDFNGDGILDLAVTNTGSNTVSVLLGNGGGTFQSAVNYSTGGFPWAMAVGDFNGDGKLDLAIASGLTQILFGNGDGTFQPAATYGSTQSNPNAVAAGDFTGQGRPSLIAGEGGSSSVSELLQSMLAPSAISVDFPLQLIQTSSAPEVVTLTNVGSQSISISGIAITGTNAADFAQNENCGSSLSPGGACTSTITFNPAQLGPRTATLTITDSAAGSPQSIALSGTGVVSGPNATLSTTTLAITCSERCRPPFGCVCRCGSTPPPPTTLSDYGNANLNITGFSATAPFTEQNSCGASLAAGNSCSIDVGIAPHTKGQFSGMLFINDNAPGSPQQLNLTVSSSCR